MTNDSLRKNSSRFRVEGRPWLQWRLFWAGPAAAALVMSGRWAFPSITFTHGMTLYDPC